METEVRAQVSRLEKLHKEDYVSDKDGSHAALREHLKSLSELALKGPICFEMLAEHSNLSQELKSIIASHPSMDVVGDTIAVVCDFCEFEDGEQNNNHLRREMFLKLVNKFMDLDIPRDIVSAMTKEEATGEIRETGMRFLSDLCEIYPTAGPEHLVERSSVLPLLVGLCTVKVGGKQVPMVDVTEASAAGDVLSTILDTSEVARASISSNSELMEKLLRGISNWKSHEPGFAEEEEWREVLHSCLRRCIEDLASGRSAFRELEGIELVVKMLSARIGHASTWRKKGAEDSSASDGLTLALELLKVALDKETESCRRFVDVSGLKYVFPIWMSSSSESESDSAVVKRARQENNNILFGPSKLALEVISLLILWLNKSDSHLQRVKSKFIKESGKLEKLVDHHAVYAQLVQARLSELEAEDEGDEDDDDDDEAKRIREEMDLMDHGLRELQQIDVILCRLLAASEGDADSIPRSIKTRIAERLDLGEEEVVEEIRQVVADMAESCVVLEGSEVDERKTTEAKTRLVEIALS